MILWKQNALNGLSKMSDFCLIPLVKYTPWYLNMIVIGAFKFIMGGWRSYFNLFSARKMKQCSKSNRVELVLGWIKPSLFGCFTETWNRNCSTLFVLYWLKLFYTEKSYYKQISSSHWVNIFVMMKNWPKYGHSSGSSTGFTEHCTQNSCWAEYFKEVNITL